MKGEGGRKGLNGVKEAQGRSEGCVMSEGMRGKESDVWLKVEGIRVKSEGGRKVCVVRGEGAGKGCVARGKR